MRSHLHVWVSPQCPFYLYPERKTHSVGLRSMFLLFPSISSHEAGIVSQSPVTRYPMSEVQSSTPGRLDRKQTMQLLTALGAELPMLFLHIHYPLTRPHFHISPSPLPRHPPHVKTPPHQDLSLDLAIPLPPFHKSVHSRPSCQFDLGERPSCLLVL